MKAKTLLTCLIALSLAGAARAQTKMSGTSQCGPKPEVTHALEVGDGAQHSLSISRIACNWTKPPVVEGVQSKSYVVTSFDDATGNTVQSRGYVVDSLANGDKAYVRYQGKVTLKDGAPETAEGTWSYTGGTGKLKGIKGKGTYKGKGGPDGTTYEIEGEYTLPKP